VADHAPKGVTCTHSKKVPICQHKQMSVHVPYKASPNTPLPMFWPKNAFSFTVTHWLTNQCYPSCNTPAGVFPTVHCLTPRIDPLVRFQVHVALTHVLMEHFARWKYDRGGFRGSMPATAHLPYCLLDIDLRKLHSSGTFAQTCNLLL